MQLCLIIVNKGKVDREVRQDIHADTPGRMIPYNIVTLFGGSFWSNRVKYVRYLLCKVFAFIVVTFYNIRFVR